MRRIGIRSGTGGRQAGQSFKRSEPSVRYSHQPSVAVYSGHLEAAMKSSAIGCLSLVACLTAAPALAATCESLAALALKDGAITKVEVVAAGTFSAPGGRQGGDARANPYKDLPEFCRVAATLT